MKALQRAKLSKAQEKALGREIKKQVAKYNEEYEAALCTPRSKKRGK